MVMAAYAIIELTTPVCQELSFRVIKSQKATTNMNYFAYRGEDIFISVWNLHRSPEHWENADKFIPERWPLDGPNPNETNQGFRYAGFLPAHLMN